MADIVERLRSNEPLPVCPFDRLSPHYWTMPDDKPCPICGQENTLEGPDRCRGADTRVMKEAADEIERLRLDIVFCREAMRHADIDLSMILPEVANTDMQKGIRKTLDRIEEARNRTYASCSVSSNK